VAGEWRDLWIYLVGPVAGAALGALAYQLVRGEHGHDLGTAATTANPATIDGTRRARLPGQIH
jgi:hypothetical protein